MISFIIITGITLGLVYIISGIFLEVRNWWLDIVDLIAEDEHNKERGI